MKKSPLQRKTPLARVAFKEPKTEGKPKPPKSRKCAVKECRAQFVPEKPFQTWCGPEHGSIIAQAKLAKQKAKQAKEQRAVDRQRKESSKSRKDWEREALTAMNRWVREVRDVELPCISCGRWHDGQWHNGHYLSRGARPNLALVELNTAKQCMPCNVHLSGNQVNFRLGLIARIGVAAVEALESDHTPRKYSIEELKAIRDEYRNRLKQHKMESK